MRELMPTPDPAEEAATNPPPPPPEKQQSALAFSLDDAEVLAAYAVRNNIQGIEGAIEGIAKARDLFATENLKGDEQRNFYAAVSTLASKIAPVTVASLRASLSEYGVPTATFLGLGPKTKISLAARAARWHRGWAMLAMFSLVVVQSYWLVGSSLINALPKNSSEEVDMFIRSKVTGSSPKGEQGSATTGKTPAEADQSNKISADDEFAREKARYLANLNNIQKEQIAHQLAGWCRVIDHHNWLKDNGKKGEELNRQMPEGWSDAIITYAARIIEVLQQSVLPLLYGWLGAMAFVLRTLSQQSRDRTFRVENQTDWDLRVWLGIVAGLAIGWFFKPSAMETSGISLVSPFALAFVAGYSVDLLFTAMDRIVTAFSGPPSDTVKPAPAVNVK